MHGDRLGILCALLAVVFLTTQDMLIKTLSDSFPLHEIVTIRAAAALCLTLVFVRMEGGLWLLRTARPGLHLARGLLVFIANTLFFLGVASMPIGEATAIFFVGPVIMTALSVPMLGERVGAWRWAAVVVGLGGCALITRPGADGFSMAALFPIGAAVAYALLQLLTRRLGVTDSASSMAFYIQLTFLASSLAVGLVIGDGRFMGVGGAELEFLFREWTWPASSDAMLMTCIGIINGIGGYLLAQAYRSGAVAVVAPFEYLSLPLALFWGFAIWRDVPDLMAVTGILLIIFAGLVVIYRDRRDGAVGLSVPARK